MAKPENKKNQGPGNSTLPVPDSKQVGSDQPEPNPEQSPAPGPEQSGSDQPEQPGPTGSDQPKQPGDQPPAEVFKQYRKKQLSEMRPYVPGEDMTGVSVSLPDSALKTLEGGYIARNPKNHEDRWYVAKQFFDDNFEEAGDDDVSKSKPDQLQPIEFIRPEGLIGIDAEAWDAFENCRNKAVTNPYHFMEGYKARLPKPTMTVAPGPGDDNPDAPSSGDHSKKR